LNISNNEDGHINFDTNGTTRMRVTSDGNVGIGTVTPIEKLHVANGAMRLDMHTQNPTKNTVYGNSMPIGYGQVSSSGVIYNDHGVASVVQNSIGNYTVTFDNSWVGDATVTVTPYSVQPRIATVIPAYGGNTVTVYTFNASGTATNTDFNIVVFGTPQ